MNRSLPLFLQVLVMLFSIGIHAQTYVKSEETKEPVSFATISFQNGYGIFADDMGKFIFTRKLYPTIDSIFVSALGYAESNFAIDQLPETIYLQSKTSELDEVVITTFGNREFKTKTYIPSTDKDYYKSWLPTIESEIAVFFENNDARIKKVASLHFPLTLESKNWEKRKKANAEKRAFSTLFKVKFYNSKDGKPHNALTNDVIVFRVTEKMGDDFELDVSEYDIIIPSEGIFASIQVLGYTDKNGKLLPNKKFKEINSRGKVVRIPTNFRPLLPFTDDIEVDRTFIKRVFIQGNEWVPFNTDNVYDSSLLKSGLNNYGMGMSVKAYKDD